MTQFKEPPSSGFGSWFMSLVSGLHGWAQVYTFGACMVGRCIREEGLKEFMMLGFVLVVASFCERKEHGGAL